MSIFSLKFITGEVDGVSQFTSVGTDASQITIGKVSFNLQLKSVVFVKEVYHPCFVRAIISIGYLGRSKPKLPDIILLSRQFTSLPVELLKYVGTSKVSIGSNYFVYRVRPLVTLKDDKNISQCDIELQIFSRDKLLSIDAFSRSYVSQRLAADIIAKQTCSKVVREKGKIGSKEVTKTSYIPPDKALPLASSYWVPFSTAKLEHTFGLCRNENNSKPWYLEYRQPYLVQYNEPFYAFISRVANRCGEMLYFERGSLVLGRSSADPIAIPQSAIEALDVRNQPLDTPLPPDVNCDFYYNYQKTISSSQYSQNSNLKVEISKKQHSHCGNVEVDVKTYVDDNIVYTWSTNDKKQPAWITKLSIVPSSNPHHRIISFDVKENDGSSDRSVTLSLYGKYKQGNDDKQETLCSITLKQTTKDNDPAPLDTTSDNLSVSKYQLPFVIDYAVDDSVDIIPRRKFSHPSHTSTLSTFFNTVITSFLNNQTRFVYRDNLQNLKTSVIQETLLASTSLLTSARYTVDKLNKDFYDSRSSMVENYNTTEQDFSDSNGSFFSSPFATPLPEGAVNISAKLYSLVSRRAQQSARRLVRVFLRPSATSLVAVGDAVTLPGDKTTYVVTRVRGSYLPDKSGKNYTEKYYFDAAPLSDVDKTFYPPIYPCAATKPMAPSVAFVDKANTDPQGPSGTARVRVRYPWDPNDSKASPWIRMLTPMAPSGGGFYFKPEEKDEVILHYVAGNPERPFVAGSFFNASAHKVGFSRYISNPTGQYIAFGDTDSFLFSTITEHIPFVNFIFSLIPPSAKKFLQPIRIDDYKQLSGKLDMGDKFGIWSISCNSAKRSVSIDSCYGSVSFSAFTGITISAPRGNVNVIGRDIRFLAANNIKFSSGLNIPASLGFANKFADKASFFADLVPNVLLGAVASTMVYTAVDISLIRSIKEVFLPPKEGSTIFHSCRFLALEAGKGKVINDPVSFANHPSNNYQRETISMISMIQQLHVVANLLSLIFKNASSLADTITDTIIHILQWKSRGVLRQDISDVDLNKFFRNDQDFIMQLFSVNYNNNNPNDFEQIKNSLEHVQTVCVLSKGFFSNISQQKIEEGPDVFNLQLDEHNLVALLFAERGVLNSFTKFAFTHDYANTLKNPLLQKVAKRSVLYECLRKSNNSLAEFTDFKNDSSWSDWVSSIAVAKPSSLASFFKSYVSRVWKATQEYHNDNYVWDENSNGAILISDDLSHTIRLDTADHQPLKSFNPDISSIIDLLMSI